MTVAGLWYQSARSPHLWHRAVREMAGYVGMVWASCDRPIRPQGPGYDPQHLPKQNRCPECQVAALAEVTR